MEKVIEFFFKNSVFKHIPTTPGLSLLLIQIFYLPETLSKCKGVSIKSIIH